jgi:two-component system response regulator (stage 0 sporulation protein F)
LDKPRLDRTALVVDDDMFVLSALAELLCEEGFDVHTASNGFSASRVALETHPAIILLDVKLPERSGGDLLHELRQEPATRDSAIVVVSANTHLLSESELAEADAVVTKPFDVGELLTIVQRELQHAAARRDEVRPVTAPAHWQAAPPRPRRTAAARRTRGRR